jgi:hypothetical protein
LLCDLARRRVRGAPHLRFSNYFDYWVSREACQGIYLWLFFWNSEHCNSAKNEHFLKI